MNSRQRVITAINQRQPDKVPVDLGATPSSGISTIAYFNLKKHLNINNKPVRVYDVVQQLAEPEWEIIEAGFEILNPVQTNTRDMDPVTLKKEFGREITFWGGGVENATVHNILPDVPPENIIAIFKAIEEFNS